MRFCGHIPNSPKNNNLEFIDPYLLLKTIFLPPKTLLYPSSIGENNFLSNFECYDLANGKE